MSLARLTPLLLTLALAGCGSDAVKKVADPPATTTAAPATTQPKGSARVAIPAGTGHLAAMAGKRGLTLRDRPGGKFLAHLRPTTEYGSPTVLWAAKQRGQWLGVMSTRLGNNRIAWLDVKRDRPLMWRSAYSLHADLSARTLELRRGRKIVRRMPIAVGAPDTPTPTGRFSLTDKLLPPRAQYYYGCCVLALSGHQPHLRPGWAGGDRIAIHGGVVGGAVSAGCMRASNAELKRLMRILPLGTPVYIRA